MEISRNPAFTQAEIEDFYEHFDGYGIFNVADIILDQMDTDDLVEDSFIEALEFDLDPWNAHLADDIDSDDYTDLLENSEQILDLCDIVEATEKGYFINE